jgi:hypothetical protein
MPRHITSRPLAIAFDRAFPVFPKYASVIDMFKAFWPIDKLMTELRIGDIAFLGTSPIMFDHDGSYSEITPCVEGWTSCLERMARRINIELDLSLMRRIAKRLEFGMLLDVADIDRAIQLNHRSRAIYLACPSYLRKSAYVDEMIDISVDELGLRRAA